MRTSRHIVFAAVLSTALLPWADEAAAEGESAGSVAVGAQTTSENGNEEKLLEDSLGEQGGLFLERLEYRSTGENLDLRVDARFTTGRSGWLDLEATGDNWSGGLDAVILTGWSNTSFADDFLPSGTPVAALFPGTTRLDPVFGVSEPRTETLRGEAWLTRRFTGFSRITLRAGARTRDGERVPNIGGFSFSDVGTASFYTAGLEQLDSSSSWLELEGVLETGPVDLRVAGGVLNVDTDRLVRMPAYGQGSLLDINEWRDALDTDTAWLRADARWSGSRADVYGAISYADTSTDPSGGDRRVDAGGAPVLDGLSTRGGSLDAEVFAAAAGVAWSPTDALTLTAALDARSCDGEGELDLFRREAPLAPARSSSEEERVGGTLQAKLGSGPYWLRFRARGTSTDSERSEARDVYSQASERTTDRVDARLDASARLAGGWSLAGWLRYDDADVDVELGDLWNGYASGDWSRTTTSGALALKLRANGVQAALSATAGATDLDSDVPWFDPIFDPSVDLIPVTADHSTTRLAGSLLWPFERGSLWIEAGWLDAEYEIPTAATTGTGFAPVSEQISGAVAALGLDLGLWQGGVVAAHLEWIEDSDDLDAEILRGQLQVDHELNATFALFVRWAYWELANNLAPSDDYEVNILAAGVQARF